MNTLRPRRFSHHSSLEVMENYHYYHSSTYSRSQLKLRANGIEVRLQILREEFVRNLSI